MRNWMIFIIVLTFCSCKNDSNMYDFKASEVSTEIVVNKSDIYENMIRNEFNALLQANILRNKNSNINDIFKEELAITIPSQLEFKSLELTAIEKSFPDDYKFRNSSYEYYYNYRQLYWDSIKQEEVIYSGVIAIDEKQQVIDNETLNTVQIIW